MTTLLETAPRFRLAQGSGFAAVVPGDALFEPHPLPPCRRRICSFRPLYRLAGFEATIDRAVRAWLLRPTALVTTPTYLRLESVEIDARVFKIAVQPDAIAPDTWDEMRWAADSGAVDGIVSEGEIYFFSRGRGAVRVNSTTLIDIRHYSREEAG